MSGRTRAAHPYGIAVLRLALAFLLCVSSFALVRPSQAHAAYPFDDQSWPSNAAYDVVYGGAWTRQTLLDWMWLYKKYGFNENFAYYSQEKLLLVASGDTRRWATRMPYFYSGTQGSIGPDANGLYMTKLEAVFVPGGSVRVWANGSAFIGKVCGNHSSVANNPLPPRITGSRYNDLNANGVKDVGEPGIAGAEVQLWTGGARAGTATTDANGFYEFVIDATRGLAPGSYEVRCASTGLWRATTATARSIQVVVGALSANKNYAGYDFGALEAGEVSGSAYFDENANGSKDPGEQPLAGRTIVLSKAGTQVGTAQTAADGSYSFPGLLPGSYTVGTLLPTPWRGTQPGSGSYSYAVVSGTRVTDADFGSTIDGQITPYMVSDLNGDGVQDAGEPLLAGWTMRLGDGGGVELRSPLVTADSLTATPLWSDLPAGAYTVWFDDQAGWSATSPTPRTISLAAGQSTTVGFSALELSEIQVAAFVDANVNGVLDAGETPLENRSLQLSKDGVQVDAATTAADGVVTFSGLTPGSYQVSEGDTPWWRHTSDPIQPITLAAGQCGQLYYGDVLTGAINGAVVEDSDGDGVAETGEPPASGVEVALTTAGGQAVGTPVTTDSSGRYTFADIEPGDYEVTAALPTGWVACSATSAQVAVTGGASTDAPTFLGAQGVTVEGTVYDDHDADGTPDAGEAGVAGREVALERLVAGSWSPHATSVSEADGSYRFELLPPGDYRAVQAPVAGWQLTTDAVLTGPLASGASVADADLGSIGLSRIEVFKYDDSNGNGSWDEGEAPLTALTLDVSGSAVDGTPFTGTVTTDANGIGSVEGLLPGTYQVAERAVPRTLNPDGTVIEPGWQSTTGVVQDVTLAEGVSERASFGSLHLGWLSGRVMHEVWNTPVAGVQVMITETGQTTTTNADGRYFFYDLEPNGTAVCPTPNYLIGMTVDGVAWMTNDSVNKSAVLSPGGHAGADFTLYDATVGNSPRTVNYWSMWTKTYTSAQMQSLVASINVGSSEFTTLTVADITPVMTLTKRSTAREKARAQYLAFWLNVSSGNLGLFTTVDVSKVTDWQSYMASAQPDGVTTVIGVISDMETVFTQQWLPAAWDAIRDILDGINGGQYTQGTAAPAAASTSTQRK